LYELTKQYALYSVITRQPYIISRMLCSWTLGYFRRGSWYKKFTHCVASCGNFVPRSNLYLKLVVNFSVYCLTSHWCNWKRWRTHFEFRIRTSRLIAITWLTFWRDFSPHVNVSRAASRHLVPRLFQNSLISVVEATRLIGSQHWDTRLN